MVFVFKAILAPSRFWAAASIEEKCKSAGEEQRTIHSAVKAVFMTFLNGFYHRQFFLPGWSIRILWEPFFTILVSSEKNINFRSPLGPVAP